MMILLIVVIALLSAALFILVSELVVTRRLNAALADRNAVQAQILARYHLLAETSERFEAECG